MLQVSSPFMLSTSALTTDSDLLVALRILAASAPELAGRAYAPAFVGQPLSAKNERRWQRMLRERVRTMLASAEAHTSAAEDEALLQQTGAPGRERAAMRRYAALVTRLGEKQLLRDVLRALELRASAVAEGAAASSRASAVGE
jgi:hypothetical protein